MRLCSRLNREAEAIIFIVFSRSFYRLDLLLRVLSVQEPFTTRGVLVSYEWRAFVCSSYNSELRSTPEERFRPRSRRLGFCLVAFVSCNSVRCSLVSIAVPSRSSEFWWFLEVRPRSPRFLFAEIFPFDEPRIWLTSLFPGLSTAFISEGSESSSLDFLCPLVCFVCRSENICAFCFLRCCEPWLLRSSSTPTTEPSESRF